MSAALRIGGGGGELRVALPLVTAKFTVTPESGAVVVTPFKVPVPVTVAVKTCDRSEKFWAECGESETVYENEPLFV